MVGKVLGGLLGKVDGRKTNIGAGIVALGVALRAAGQTIPAPEVAPWLTWAGETLIGVGAAGVGVGLGHKVEKARKEARERVSQVTVEYGRDIGDRAG